MESDLKMWQSLLSCITADHSKTQLEKTIVVIKNVEGKILAFLWEPVEPWPFLIYL